MPATLRKFSRRVMFKDLFSKICHFLKLNGLLADLIVRGVKIYDNKINKI